MKKLIKYMLGIAFAMAAIFVFPVVSDAATVTIRNGASIQMLGTSQEDAKQGMRFLIRVEDAGETDDFGIELSYINPNTGQLVNDDISISAGYDKIYDQGDGWKEYAVVITGITQEYFTTKFTAKGFVEPEDGGKTYASNFPEGVTRSIYEVSERAGYALAENGTLLKQETLDLSEFSAYSPEYVQYDPETKTLTADGGTSTQYLAFPLSEQLEADDAVQISINGTSGAAIRVYLGTNGNNVGSNQSSAVTKSNLPEVWNITSNTNIGSIAIKGDQGAVLPALTISSITVTYLGSGGNVPYELKYKVPAAQDENEFYIDLGGTLASSGAKGSVLTSAVSADELSVSYPMDTSGTKIILPCSAELKEKLVSVSDATKISFSVKGTSSVSTTFRACFVSLSGSSWNRFNLPSWTMTDDPEAQPYTFSFSGTVANAGTDNNTADYFMIHMTSVKDTRVDLEYIKIVFAE